MSNFVFFSVLKIYKWEAKTMQVVKRDGKLEEFDPAKIEVAIKKANIQAKKSDKISKADIEEIVNEVTAKCELKKKVKVEEIQDLIVPELYKKSPKLAQSFERYRYKREVGRTGSSEFLSAIKEKLEASDVQNQNANVDEKSFGGRMGETNSLVMKRYALDYCMSTMARENHLNNEICIHDLDSYAVGMHNCLSVPFDKLLAEGFTTRQTDVRPANSINSAFQLVAVIFQLQSLQQFGGVSATHLDWTMVPYVRRSFRKHYLEGLKWVENAEEFEIDPNTPIDSQIYKDHPKAYEYANAMTTKETYQAVKAMYHNLNTLKVL